MDPQQGLSPDEAAVLAVLLNPTLRAARDQRALADAQLLEAGMLPNPELGYGFETPVGGDTAGTVNAFGIELDWDAMALITRSARRGKAEAHRAAVEMDIAWREWQTAQAAKASVYELVSLERQAGLARQAERQMDRNVELVRSGVERGVKTSKDLAAAEASQRKAQEQAIGFEKDAARQRLVLHGLLGLPPAARVGLRDDISLPAAFAPPPAATLLGGLEKRRLDLIALRHGYDSQEAAVRAAILGQFPRIRIGPIGGRDTDNVATAGVALSVSFPIFDRNQGAIAAETAARQKLFDEYVERVAGARSDIEMVLSRIHYLSRQIATAVAAEPVLQRLVDEYRKALDGGRVDALTYYAAWNELTTSRIKLLDLKGQLAQAIVALELAAGMYEVPQSPVPASAPAGPTTGSRP